MNRILIYHSIGTRNNSEVGAELYSVSVENFKQQMEYIKKSGTVPEGDCPCISFDDGDITNYQYALPVLREFGLKAYFFILVGKIGEPGYMNWEQIKEIRDAGMIIGSHGMTHKILAGLSEGDLDYEIRISKKILEDELRCAIDYFSVPRGFYNKDVIDQAKNNGYKAVFTSNPKDDDGFKIGRIPVKGTWDLEYFVKVINNGYSMKDNVKEKVRSYSKIILGSKNYDRLRTRILKK